MNSLWRVFAALKLDWK